MFTEKTFFAYWQEKAVHTASKNHEKKFLSGTILEKKNRKSSI